MAESEDTTNSLNLDYSDKFVTVFPPHTTCALLGTSLSGKSTYLKFILKNIDSLFELGCDISAVYIVYCDIKSTFHFSVKDTLTDYCDIFPCIYVNNKPLYQTYLSDFEPENLSTNSILIFEDVSDFHSLIKSSIHFYTHHLKLAATFIVCQTLSGRLSELSLLVQKVIFFTRSKSVAKEFKLVLNKFFPSDTYKQYLQTVYQFVEQSNDKLLLSLFNQYSKQLTYLALSHLELLEIGGAKAYTGPFSNIDFDYTDSMDIDKTFLDNYSEMAAGNDDAEHAHEAHFGGNNAGVEIPKNTLILMPVKYLNFKKQEQVENDGTRNCLNSKQKEEWNSLISALSINIEEIFKIKERTAARFLMKEILSNPNFCITSNKMISLNKKPNEPVSILDFIKFCIRSKAPHEQLNSSHYIYRDMKRALTSNGTPENVFKNALLRI